MIVNITSVSEREAFPGSAVYAGTKFFWAGATSSLRSVLCERSFIQIQKKKLICLCIARDVLSELCISVVHFSAIEYLSGKSQ